MKNKYKVSALIVLSLLVLSGSVFTVVKADQGFWDKVVQKVSEIVAGKVDAPIVSEQTLGAVSGPDLPNPNCVGNLCTFTIEQTFIDASTTIVSIPDPFLMVTTSVNNVLISGKLTGASSTVDLVRLDITGVATTSFSANCGASTGPTVSASTNALLSSGIVPTSTAGFLENNLTGALGGVANGGTVPKIAVGPSLPYFTCTLTESVAGGVTNPQNTLTGRAIVRFYRFR